MKEIQKKAVLEIQFYLEKRNKSNGDKALSGLNLR